MMSHSTHSASGAVPPEVTDDDLDEYLDSILDNFTIPATSSSIPTPATSSKAPPAVSTPAPTVSSASTQNPAPAPLDDDEEFMRQLAGGMEQLLAGATAEGGLEGSDDAAFRETMERIVATVKEMGVGPEAGGASDQKAKGPEKMTFQDRVQQTVEKLKDSSANAQAEAAQPSNDDAVEQMVKEFESLMQNGELDSMFKSVMENLYTKDLLYEPMKDLAARYPGWLDENKATLSDTDVDRYQKQHEIVKQVLAIFDGSAGTETTPEEAKRVSDLMIQMQDYGSPPEAILQELAPGLEFGPDGAPKVPGAENCPMM